MNTPWRLLWVFLDTPLILFGIFCHWWLIKVPKRNVLLNTLWRLLWVFLYFFLQSLLGVLNSSMNYLKETFSWTPLEDFCESSWIPLEDFLESLANWWLIKVPKRNVFLNTPWRLLWVFLDHEWILQSLRVLDSSIKYLKETFWIPTDPLVW